jgi:YD repeat-containing protein
MRRPVVVHVISEVCRVIRNLSAVLILFSVLETVALAQFHCNADPIPSNSCTLHITPYCAGDTYPVPLGAKYYCDGVPRICTPGWVTKCAQNAAEETCPYCPKTKAGSPVNLANGDTFIEQTDVRLPGLGSGLTLLRTWNSKWPTTQVAFKTGLFGPNWRSTYEERVFLGSDSTIKYSRSDGSFWSFAFINYVTSNGNIVGSIFTTVAPSNIAVTLTTGPSYWTMVFPSGETRLFDNASGKLTAIIDRNGNTTQVSYDGEARLTTVTDPAGRHIYFSYPDNSTFLISGVTSDAGISLAYIYDSQGRLVKVVKPDQTWVSFEYDGNSLISAVKDSDGKVLESHVYDSQGRGLTSSRALGVESITIAYPQQQPPLSTQ